MIIIVFSPAGAGIGLIILLILGVVHEKIVDTVSEHKILIPIMIGIGVFLFIIVHPVFVFIYIHYITGVILAVQIYDKRKIGSWISAAIIAIIYFWSVPRFIFPKELSPSMAHIPREFWAGRWVGYVPRSPEEGTLVLFAGIFVIIALAGISFFLHGMDDIGG